LARHNADFETELETHHMGRIVACCYLMLNRQVSPGHLRCGLRARAMPVAGAVAETLRPKPHGAKPALQRLWRIRCLIEPRRRGGWTPASVVMAKKLEQAGYVPSAMQKRVTKKLWSHKPEVELL